jgi:ribosomal-protein-alanine N-acetyltransferase
MSPHPLIPRFDFGPFPVLESERLILRQLVPADADAIMAIKGDVAVTRYNGGEPYTDRQQALDLIERVRTGYTSRKWLRWGLTLRPDDAVIGMIGFNHWNRADFRADVGYDLTQAYWGRGLMPEALRAVLAFGFAEMALNRVEAEADVANLASIRVLQKLGFQNEGFQLEKYYNDDTFQDIALFGLLRRNYLR